MTTLRSTGTRPRFSPAEKKGDDTFLVRSFVRVDPNDPKAPFTNINGGQGADLISFTVNAPVRIEGGDGFDTLTVVGTEFGDDFVVNEFGVFGGGLVHHLLPESRS